MIRFRSISIALIVAALSLCAHAQGTTGGLLYASDFANWTLPQGNTPAQGAIIYPNQDICKVTSNGYTFLAPKVGRPITIVDGANTETVTPTSVVVGSIGCIISAVMTHSHSSYFLKSGTGGAQEAVDYQASQPQGANVILTPAWTQAGGTTGTITSTLKGNTGVTILDQRTAQFTPYIWNGSAYVAQPFTGGNIAGLTSGVIPLATSPTGITANSALDDGVTTPSTVTSTEAIAAPLFSAPRLRVTACTTGQVPFGDGTGGCVTPGAGGSPGGSNLQLQFNNSGAFGGATGISTDSATKSALYAAATIPALTPHADIRNIAYAGGAACDGAADDAPATQLAINAAMASTGPGVVYIPNGCHFANGSGFTTPQAGKQLTFELQGTLAPDSTFVLPRGAALKCLGNGTNPQFASGSATCNVTAPTAKGTLGTAITSTNTAVTITPTFTSGSIANMTQFSAITFAGVMTCDMPTVTRTFLAGTFPGDGPANVSVTIGNCTNSSGNSTAFRIPAAAKIIIAGCSDPTLNGTFFSAVSDFSGLTLGYRMVGAASTVADDTCQISGLNLDSLETERIDSTSGNTITLRTNHVHAATDLWGMVGVSMTLNDLKFKLIEGLQVTNNYGAGIWFPANSMITMNGTSFTGVQYMTSIPMVFSSSYGWTWANSQTSSFSYYTCPAAGVSCGDIGPPFDMMLDLLPQSLFAQNSVTGGLIGPNSTLSIGMYLTARQNSVNSAALVGPIVHDSVIEQPMWNGITFDSRTSGPIYQTTIDNSLIQDNHNQSRAAWVGMSNSGAYRKGQLSFFNNVNLAYGPATTPASPFLTVNQYWCGQVNVSGASTYTSFVMPSCPQATVTYADGTSFVGELNTPPSPITTIPYATKPVNVTASTWTCSGTGCSVTSGQKDPWGGTNAALVTSGSASATSVVYSYSGAVTTAGDVFLYGAWVRCQGDLSGNSTGMVAMSTFGADTFDVLNNSTYAPNIQNQGWHTTVGMSVVLTGAASHSITFQLVPSNRVVGTGCYFAQPFVLHVLASDNIPMDEIQRWRTTMLHGYVPPGLSGGVIKAMAPTDKLYWGNDTNLYRNALTATITQVGFLGNVGTIVATNSFHAGQVIVLSGLTTNTDLNFPTTASVTVATASPTQFTFSKTHSNVTLAADTGTALANGGIVKSDGDVDARAFLLGGSYGTSGQFMQSTGSGTQWATSAASEPGATYDFTPTVAASGLSCTGASSPYTCVLPPICNLINYDILSGGSGGGSGATAAAGANGFGGGGGAAGEAQRGVVACAAMGGPGATIVVTVGIGGNGGPVQAGASTSGSPGTGGGVSKVAGPAGYSSVASSAGAGASFGAGGTATTGTAGAQSPNLSNMGICPGSAGSSGAGAAQACQVGTSASSGGAGGGGLVAGTASAGGAQTLASTAQSIRGPAIAAASATGGVNTGGNGQTPAYNVTPLALFLYSALGGTGGGASCAAAGGTGGTGMEPGGGGAGGGAACNGFSSGAGGVGGVGHVRLIIE